MPVTFHKADVKFTVPAGTLLKKFMAQQALTTAGKKLQVSYVFCTDDYLLNINRQFLQHDYYTDIITFPLNAPTEKTIQAEIYISIDRVADNARQLKTEFNHELYRVIFHGILHLLGYKDKTKAQQAEMRKMEDMWLHSFSLYQS
jgi:rRNA maturation RNase YbeY